MIFIFTDSIFSLSSKKAIFIIPLSGSIAFIRIAPSSFIHVPSIFYASNLNSCNPTMFFETTGHPMRTAKTNIKNNFFAVFIIFTSH
jgi:hypothetical protein